MTRLHSEHGASICDRWWNCPGSVNLTRGMPNESSEAAQRGTAAHAVAELCLTNKRDAIEYVGRTVEGVEVDAKMAEDVQEFIDWCRAGEFDVVMVEQQFDLATLDPPAPRFGTADFVGYSRHMRKLFVKDYKNGFKFVDAAGNRQMRYYALGAVMSLPAGMTVREIEVQIVQPNAIGRDTAKRETFDAVELAEWALELMARARATMPPDAPLHAGSWCHFCPASGRCPEQARESFDIAQLTMPGLPADLTTLTPEMLGSILARLPVLEAFAKEARAAATAELHAGRPVPGWKLTPNRASSAWVDADTAPAVLAMLHDLPPDACYAPREPISPAVARGLVAAAIKAARDVEWLSTGGKKPTKKAAEDEAKARLFDLIRTASTGVVLAPVADERPGLPAPGTEFTALNIESET